MKAYPLTSPQQAQAATLKAAVATAQAALVAANQALAAYLASSAGVTPKGGQRLQLTSDGTSAILTP
jgi:hypothetical protein